MSWRVSRSRSGSLELDKERILPHASDGPELIFRARLLSIPNSEYHPSLHDGFRRVQPLAWERMVLPDT